MADADTIFIIKGPETLLSHAKNSPFFSEEQLDDDDNSSVSQHASFAYEDHGTPAPNRSSPFVLRVTTNNVPNDGLLGFLIGRHPEKCDIVLGDDRISEAQLSVKVKWQFCTLLLQNKSRHGTQVTFTRQNETKVLKGTQVLMDFETADIWLGDDLYIQIQRKANPVHWTQYCADLGNNLNGPSLALLGLDTQPETTNASQRQPVYIKDVRLGQGAYAEVFKAIEKYTGEVYAMKLYGRPEKVRWQEQAALKHLNHEHIVRYIAYIDLPSQPAQLIMEYVEGPTLYEVLDQRNRYPLFTKSETRDVLQQLLLAVDYLHGNKVTHRDIKPANIILVHRHPVHVKLVDFGFATKALSFDTNCGTPLYLAPELLDRRGRSSNKVDIFAIGVVALSLFGVSFDLRNASGPRDCLRLVLEQKQLLIAGSQPPPAHYDLANLMLAESPKDRPSAKECLAHLFFQDGADLDSDPGWDPDVNLDQTGDYGLAPDLCTQLLDTGYGHGAGCDSDGATTEIADTPSGFLNPEPASGFAQQLCDDNGSGASEGSDLRSRRSRQQSSSSASASASASVSALRKRHKKAHPRKRHKSTMPPALVTNGCTTATDDEERHASTSISTSISISISGIYEAANAIDNPRHGAQGAAGQVTSSAQGISDKSSSEADLYDGCWLDPLHAFGAGSSLSDHHRTTNTTRRAASQPTSDTTPNFHSFSELGVGEPENQDRHSRGADGAAYGPRITTQPPTNSAAAQVVADFDSFGTDGVIPARDTPYPFSLHGSTHFQPFPGIGVLSRTEETSAANGEGYEGNMGGEEYLENLNRAGTAVSDSESETPTGEHAMSVVAVQYISAECRTPDNEEDEEHEEYGEYGEYGAAVDDASVPGALVINGCAIATDDGDGRVSVHDVCEAAKTDSLTRLRYCHIFEGRGILVKRREQSWVPFRDGCFLCDALGLDPHPLLRRSALDPAILLGNYLLLDWTLPPQYSVLWWNSAVVLYAPETCALNLTSLVQAYGKKKHWVHDLLTKNQHIAKTRVRGYGRIQGTYVALNDAYQLCEENGFDTEPVRAIAASCAFVLDGS